MSKLLAKRIAYKFNYFKTPDDLLSKILNKTVVPYKVELHPGRLKGKNICWMKCPYCYGGSSENTAERLSPERYLKIIDQMANGPNGNIKKIIFAGYATDPLNYEYIDDLFEATQNHGQITGIHSKLLKISDKLIKLITSENAIKTSYLTVSVDAGSPETYNLTHDIKGKSNVYGRVIDNLYKINELRNSKSNLDIAVNYLLTKVNSDTKVVIKGIEDLISTGVDAIRFSFPQLPRGEETFNNTIMPNRNETNEIYKRLEPVIKSYNNRNTNVVILDVDKDHNINERRTLPCFARFIYPAISYDGYLSNCSQSGAAHFKNMSLGNLATSDFWDSFYSYDKDEFWKFLDKQHDKMIMNDCRCDRKEHTINQMFKTAFGKHFDGNHQK